MNRRMILAVLALMGMLASLGDVQAAGTRLEAQLTPTSSFSTSLASGKARYEVKNGVNTLTVEVEDLDVANDLFDIARVTVKVNGLSRAGSVVVAGGAKMTVTTFLGNPIDFKAGDVVTIHNQFNFAVLRGTLQ